jgi:hypothetical protein
MLLLVLDLWDAVLGLEAGRSSSSNSSPRPRRTSTKPSRSSTSVPSTCGLRTELPSLSRAPDLGRESWREHQSNPAWLSPLSYSLTHRRSKPSITSLIPSLHPRSALRPSRPRRATSRGRARCWSHVRDEKRGLLEGSRHTPAVGRDCLSIDLNNRLLGKGLPKLFRKERA